MALSANLGKLTQKVIFAQKKLPLSLSEEDCKMTCGIRNVRKGVTNEEKNANKLNKQR